MDQTLVVSRPSSLGLRDFPHIFMPPGAIPVNRVGQIAGRVEAGKIARGDQAEAQNKADWDESGHQRFKLAMFCSISSEAWIDLELTS